MSFFSIVVTIRWTRLFRVTTRRLTGRRYSGGGRVGPVWPTFLWDIVKCLERTKFSTAKRFDTDRFCYTRGAPVLAAAITTRFYDHIQKNIVYFVFPVLSSSSFIPTTVGHRKHLNSSSLLHGPRNCIP